MDEEGYFFITDRLKRMINASGFKVWPAEVEALMFRHPAIAEACVIAAQDSYRGETVKAVVVLRASHQGQVTEQDIMTWCREHMAVYKAPKIVQFALKLDSAGKVKLGLSTAKGLIVAVDGAELKEITPELTLDLAAGTHRISLLVTRDAGEVSSLRVELLDGAAVVVP